ncbi:SMC-Scp complex subunit ScpB [Candidatus Woesearchaeota archaeon]|nr:SMC-Scp complex subunit ScpB [Candidatus Woesearchaeota archaeon]
MENDPKKVEAVLFAVGKEITTERIASLCSLTIERTEEIIAGLQQEYNSRDHSLRLVQKESGWKLTVRDEFIPLVSSIVSSTELERPLMETLAVIAWKYPIVQSDVIKLRSASAYDHLKALEEQGYIAKEKTGRTFKIKLTKKFFEYFDLPSEEAKQAFLKFVPIDVLNEAEQVHKEADEVERLVELDLNKEEAKEEIKKAMGEMNSVSEEKNKEK